LNQAPDFTIKIFFMKEELNWYSQNITYAGPRQPKPSPGEKEKESQEEGDEEYTEEVWGDEADEGDEFEEDDDEWEEEEQEPTESIYIEEDDDAE
jgi:hypothetical protein